MTDPDTSSKRLQRSDHETLIELWRSLARALLGALSGDVTKLQSQHLAVARQFLTDNGITLKSRDAFTAREELRKIVDKLPNFDPDADTLVRIPQSARSLKS